MSENLSTPYQGVCREIGKCVDMDRAGFGDFAKRMGKTGVVHLTSDKRTRHAPERIFDVYVSVQRYGAQVEYGRGGAHDVDGDPYVAELGAEHPVALQVVDQSERHD